MGRKVSDMVLLLGSRSRPRTRGKSALGNWFSRISQMVFGTSRSERQGGGWLSGGRQSGSRAGFSGVWLLAVVGLACFAAGYLTAGRFAGIGDPGSKDGASKTELRSAGVIGEPDTKPKSNQALIVAAYEGVAADEAKARAVALAEYLRKQKFSKCKPYESKTAEGALWLVVVYYDNDLDLRVTRDRLLQLPADIPDEFCVRLRRDGWQGGESKIDWPIPWSVQ